MEELRKLWEMQKLELKFNELQDTLHNQPLVKELKILKRDIETEQENLKKAKDEYDNLKKVIKIMEIDIANLKEKIKKVDFKLYSGEIKNIKELENTSEQLEKLNLRIKETEDELLKVMAEKEHAYSRLVEKNNKLKEKKDKFRLLNSRYKENIDNIKNELEQIPGQISAIKKSIDKSLLDTYEIMKKKFNAQPVAIVQKGVCSGCHMNLSYDLLNALKTSNEIKYCDNCSRILYPVD